MYLMMNSMNTPIPTVAAIGSPSSATSLKNCVIIMCVFNEKNSGGVESKSFAVCKFCKFKFTKNLHRLQRMTRNLQDFVYYLL